MCVWVCVYNGTRGRAGSQQNQMIMNTFSEVLLCYRSWGINMDFIKLLFLAGEVPGSLSHFLQDSCFILVLTFTLICFDGLKSTWQATQDRNVLALAEKKKKICSLSIKADSHHLWTDISPREFWLSFLNILHKWEEGHENNSVQLTEIDFWHKDT